MNREDIKTLDDLLAFIVQRDGITLEQARTVLLVYMGMSLLSRIVCLIREVSDDR